MNKRFNLPIFKIHRGKFHMTDSENFIRAVSFNVRYKNMLDFGNSWDNRKEMAASMIEFHHVDTAGLQEVVFDQLQDLIYLLPDYNWIGVGRGDGKNEGEYSPIFYKKSIFDLLDSGTFWLSETPDVPGSKGWDALCVRIVTWAKFKRIKDGSTFFHFNTHFDHFGKKAVRQSAYLLLNKIEDIAENFPVVVTGDFNCNNRSDVYNILTGNFKNDEIAKRSLIDSYKVSINPHHGPDISFHSFKAAKIFDMLSKRTGISKENIGSSGKYGSLIDFIFIKNNVKVLNHGILSDTWNGKYPSDHMPVVADILI